MTGMLQTQKNTPQLLIPCFFPAVLLLLLTGCETESTAPPVSVPIDKATEKDVPVEEPKIVHVDYVKPNLTAEEIRDGWISLFDGVSLYGWHANSSANWTATEGVITADSGDRGLLLTGFQIANFEFRCDFQVSKGGNSGVFFRTSENPEDPATDCYELNICDTHAEFKTGSLVGRAKPAGEELVTDGHWNTFHVRVAGTMVEVDLNGKRILEYRDRESSKLGTGFIGLQMNQGAVAFRNVFLKPVGMESLFDGKSLAGWEEVPGGSAKFTVEDQTIHVTKGPGFLQTQRTYGDFVFQSDVRVNADDTPLNSGIFFRAMPGTEDAPSNGYEFQIQNGFKNDDRHLPEDSGTGAIFRRIEARYVPANDNEWLTATLIAQGPRICTWVDGYQVVEWTDQRKPNENPRRGLRTDAGHISLQAHDPTTNINFRSLRIAPTLRVGSGSF